MLTEEQKQRAIEEIQEVDRTFEDFKKKLFAAVAENKPRTKKNKKYGRKGGKG